MEESGGQSESSGKREGKYVCVCVCVDIFHEIDRASVLMRSSRDQQLFTSRPVKRVVQTLSSHMTALSSLLLRLSPPLLTLMLLTPLLQQLQQYVYC